MKYAICLLLSLSMTVLLAQNQNGSGNKLQLEGTTEEIYSYKEMNGSPFRYKEFVNGKINLKTNNSPIDYLVNYNAHKDHFEFIENNTTYAIANPNKLKNILVEGETFVYTEYYNYEDLKKGYFIELIDDYISLYKRELISITSQKNVAYKSTPYVSGNFIRLKPKYYISIYGEPLMLIKSKKKLLNLFFNHPEINKYIKKEKIKLHEEEDLKKLVTFLNEFDKKR